MPSLPQNPHHRVPRPRPAVARALAYLDDLGDARHEKSIARIAYEAGVSYVSMWKALQSRPRVPRTPAQMPGNAPSSQVSRARVRNSIKADLLNGRLPSRGVFPQIKELQKRYGAGFRTVKAALEVLRSNGRLVRTGRSYSSATHDRPAAPSLRIGVLAYNWDAGRSFTLYSGYQDDYVHELERECWQRHIDVEVLPYYHEGETTVVQSLHAPGRPDHAWSSRSDGFIVLIGHVNCLMGNLAQQLKTGGKPVLLLDEMSGWKTSDFLADTRRVLRICSRPFRSAAELVGEEILARGHRHIAFFSAFHHDRWSRESLEGLTDALTRAGVPAPRAFLEYGSQTDQAFDYTDRARASPVNGKIRQCYAACRARMSAAYAIQLDPFFSSLFDEHLVYAETRHVMEKHLAAAATDKQITCWIASDHDMAMYVGDYLHAHRPELSLVSFGSSREITNKRISSVDFNAAAAARASVEFLLYPQRKLPGQTGMELEIQGMMVDRGSLRNA
jgi:DNA-binding LacI/PurR family transcriptional regulator